MNLSELTKLYDFTGRTVAITGATGVLCSSMAESLAACGANVVLVVRNRDKGEQLANRLPGPGQPFVVVSDALDRKSLDQAAETIIGRFGQLDGLINGAGGNHPQATARPDQSFFDLTPAMRALPTDSLDAAFIARVEDGVNPGVLGHYTTAGGVWAAQQLAKAFAADPRLQRFVAPSSPTGNVKR